jgi:hypothetical protein
METNPSSHPNAQTNASASGPDATKKPARRPKSKRFWSYVRAAILLLATIGFGVPGYQLRPTTPHQLSVSEPTITVLANQQNVTAKVDMTLSAKSSSYSLTLTLTPVNPPAKAVRLAVWFNGFPTPVSSSTPLFPFENAYYATGTLLPGSSEAASKGQGFTYRSSRRIGEATNGLQLRVAFPDLVGEEPGSQYSYQACGLGVRIQAFFAPICKGLGSLSMWYTPVLEADTTKLSSDDPSLQGYQVLAGDNPTLLGGDSWTWIGINGVTMLAANVSAEANQEHHLFYSGVFFGVTAGALVALFNELVRPIWRRGGKSS